MATRWHCCRHFLVDDSMELVRIQKQDFSVTEEIVRLDFEHYPGMAEKKLQEIRVRALDNFNIIEMGIVHRIGKIEIGENIVLIVAAAQHRNDAFMACEWAIAELKRITHIWKKEIT